MAKKSFPMIYVWLGVGAVILLLLLWFVATFNTLVVLNQDVENKWADVETQYQRRADLIPNLVSTVKGFAKQELTVFTEVTALRSQWTNAVTREQKIAAAESMNKELDTTNPNSILSRLLVVVEQYPQLKSDQNFLALQDELAGTENRVSVARMRYNEAVKFYNVGIKRIPTNIIAGMFGYKDKAYFAAEEGAAQAPTVEF